MPNLPDIMKGHFIAEKAGHYGIFSGSAWRNDIRPAVLKFIDAHNGAPKTSAKVTKLKAQ
jgi:poly(3-hydroxybutyrate) depolymerase